MRLKMDVADVQLGMYVAELDRPWLESPFLFQGFVLDSEDDLETLREHCNYVFVDDEKSVDPQAAREAASGKGREEKESPEEPDSENSANAAKSFRSNIKRAVQTFKRSTGSVIKFFDDARLGKSIDTNDAKAVVSDLVTTITNNVNTALWLTSLRNRTEEGAAHCLNTSILSVAFARHLGYSHDQMQLVGLGALLHDIGFARTPKSILEKPGELTDKEYATVKKHPRDGHAVLKLTHQIPDEALDIVLHHHERLDGSGYPDGLKGEELGEMVRVVAIADAYDSMTSERVYRKAIAPQDALTTLHKRAAEEFGQSLMEEFIKCVGIYPIGSLVLLNTGALGVVVSSNPDARLKPLILMVRDEQGRDLYPRKLVNLATLSAHQGEGAWSISRVVRPGDYGIDIAAIAAEDMNFS